MQWLVLLLLAATPSRGMVINRVFGANGSEVAFASAGGGAHVYLSGTDIGSAFAPPDVFIGINADARCVVQPFTSTKNRLHCIVNAEGLHEGLFNFLKDFILQHKELRVSKGSPCPLWSR